MSIRESDINRVIAPLEAKKKELEEQRAECLFIENRYTILQDAFFSDDKVAEYYTEIGIECPSNEDMARAHFSSDRLNSQIKNIDDMIASILHAEKRLMQE